jgi:hypothetical protein
MRRGEEYVPPTRRGGQGRTIGGLTTYFLASQTEFGEGQ